MVQVYYNVFALQNCIVFIWRLTIIVLYNRMFMILNCFCLIKKVNVSPKSQKRAVLDVKSNYDRSFWKLKETHTLLREFDNKISQR